MTNLQGSAPNPLIGKLLFWTPIGLGGLFAAAVLAIGTIPLMSQVQIKQRQHDEKRALEERLPQLRARLNQTALEQSRAEQQQSRLLGLIAGSGNLATFMALADREASRHGVQLQQYEPTTAAAAVPTDKADPLKGQAKGSRAQAEQAAETQQSAAAASQNDPLQKAGLKNSQLLINARGRYTNLLAFLRALESLEVLVVQSHLNLAVGGSSGAATGPQSAASNGQGGNGAAPVEMKLAIALYQR